LVGVAKTGQNRDCVACCFLKRSDQVSGFVVLTIRWIVERTIAWLNRCGRLAKDWENSTERFLRLASIRLMLRKLCNPA
jgi:putative transposase